MIQMFIHGGAVNQDVVEEDDDETTKVGVKYHVHSCLKKGRHIA